MLRREEYLMIRDMRRRGMYIKDIAARLGVHPRTVRRALKRDDAPSRTRPGARKSKLDPYKEEVDRLLQNDVWNARVIHRELQAHGFDGGYSIVRDYVRPRRSLQPSKATVRYETEPGRQLQHDWTDVATVVAGEAVTVKLAANLLGYSRRFHAWAAPKADAEHTYESLIRAFEHFGGVPEEVLVDNQKSAVLANRAPEAVRFNARFVDLAGYYGFTPKACRPYRARTKGKVERAIRYLKENFFVRYRAFDSLAHLNQQLEAWLAEEADRRAHDTHKEVVRQRFDRDEAGVLQPLPRTRFDTSYREQRWASWDGYVSVRGNRYSVPADYCGQTVTVRVSLDDQLRIVDTDERVIARHRLRPASEGWRTVADHHAPLWQQVAVQVRDLATYEEVG